MTEIKKVFSPKTFTFPFKAPKHGLDATERRKQFPSYHMGTWGLPYCKAEYEPMTNVFFIHDIFTAYGDRLTFGELDDELWKQLQHKARFNFLNRWNDYFFEFEGKEFYRRGISYSKEQVTANRKQHLIGLWIKVNYISHDTDNELIISVGDCVLFDFSDGEKVYQEFEEDILQEIKEKYWKRYRNI